MNIKVLAIVVVFILGTISSLSAQGRYDWWYEVHQIDPNGAPWKSYMIISPGYLGVNALPVPTQLKGEVGTKIEFEMAADAHFLKGERTQNAFVRIFYPFQNGRISVEVWGVPKEYYNYNQQIRDERMSRVEDGKGWEIGDFYFSTNIKLLDEHLFNPSLVLRMACKTASGELTGARYTDTPAYWFDLSTGKSFGNERFTIRPFAMYGFYCWQTMSAVLLQNDAHLYGAGFEIKMLQIRFENSVQGYHGYKRERDRPFNYRFIVAKSFNKSELKLEYQQGLRDVLYKSVRLGWVQRF